MSGPELTPLVAALPAAVPFVGPEAIERRDHVRFTVRVGANESLFGPAPSVLAAMAAAGSRIQIYGDPEGWDLRAALAQHHGLSLDQLVLGSGADELLGLFVRAYVEPGQPVAMSHGGYATFAYHVTAHGARLEPAPYRAFRNDVEALVRRATETAARVLYLANPDNPTGSWLDRAELQFLLDHVPVGCLVLLDEAYAQMAPPGAMLDPALDHPALVRVRTFSKAYGLAGMRVGYAFGRPSLVRPIDRIRNQFGVGCLAQAAALAALGAQDHVAAVVAETEQGRLDCQILAEELGFRALPSATNFVAIDIGNADRARAILTALQQEGVFIRMPGVAPLDRCIRVTIGRPADRAAFAAAFRRVVARV